MATIIRPRERDHLKWAFFGLMGLCTLLVLYVDERFVLNAADPHWRHIAPVKWLLLFHGLFGAVALVAGAFQFSDTLRATRPRLHRRIGYAYLGAITIAAPIAIIMGTSTLEPVSIRFEQWFQGGFWWISAAIALLCIRSRKLALHKEWMMRSYAFTLVFILSRVPDAFIAHYSDQFLSDMLWSLVAIGLVAPNLILTARALRG